MALFGRGNDKEKLLEKIAQRAWSSPAEKREWIDLLRQAGALKAPEYVALLLLGDPECKQFAIEGITALGDTRTLDYLLGKLGSTPASKWSPLIIAIHGLHSSALPSRVEKMLSARRPEHRIAAAEVLAADPRWHAQLSLVRRALKSEDPEVRRRVVKLLRLKVRDDAVHQLVRDQLHNPDDIVRHGAIEALANNPNLDVIEELFDLLPDEPTRIQDQIIRGLGRSIHGGGPFADQAIGLVLPLMAADNERIRMAAARLLASMPDKIAVMRRFMRWAKGIAFWLRDRAFHAVATVADNLGEAILDLLRDDDIDVVVGATAMASQCGDPCVVAGLSEIVCGTTHEWWVKINALEAAARFPGHEPNVILTLALEQEDLKPAAIACLGLRGDHKALPQIFPFLADPRRSVRLATLQAMTRIQAPEMVPQLDHVARTDTCNECRLRALELLDGLGPEGVAAAAAIRHAVQRANAAAAQAVELSMVNAELNES